MEVKFKSILIKSLFFIWLIGCGLLFILKIFSEITISWWWVILPFVLPILLLAILLNLFFWIIRDVELD